MKIRVVVIDDELIEAEGQKRRILRMDLERIGTVSVYTDGSRALQELKMVSEPVIALVDINMPGVNGLDLMHLLQDKQNLRFIVISAYDEFKYAQKSMSYGVKYYLLKPCSFYELKQAIEACISELDTQISLPDAWIQNLSTLSGNQLSADLASVEMAHYPFYCLIYSEYPFLYFDPDKIAHKYEFLTFFHRKLLLINMEHADCLHTIVSDLKSRNFARRAVISQTAAAADLKKLFWQVTSLLEVKASIREKTFLWADQEPLKPRICDVYPHILHLLEKHIHERDYNALRKLLMDTISETLYRYQVSSVNQLLESIMKSLYNLGLHLHVHLAADAKDWKSLEHLEDILSHMLHQLDVLEQQEARSTYHYIIQWSLEYIEHNLADKEKLNMTLLANRWNLNYSYYSQLFKKETGVTFSEYIAQRRMQVAADKILEGHELSDLAEEIGLSGKSSFFRAFKNYYHMTPAEWKKKNYK